MFLPLLLVAAGVIAFGTFLFQLAMAADLGAGAQDAADAAALAAADVAGASLSSTMTSAPDGPTPSETSAERRAAEDYAERNGAVVVEYERVGRVVVVTVESVHSLGALEWLGVARSRSRATAAAAVTFEYGATLPRVEGKTLSGEDIDALEQRSGLRVRPGSALMTYGSDCSAGVDVVHLSAAMKVAILRLEHAMGRPLRLNSGYRDHACQAELFARVTGPVAPPGRSLHNYGQAVDVAEPSAVAMHAREAGLCQPLPATDAVHFSLASSSECAGVAGVLPSGGAYGGDADSFVTYNVKLVDVPEASP